MKKNRWMQGVAKSMKHRGTEGSFSAAAKRHGMSTKAYADAHKHSKGLVGQRSRLVEAFAAARHNK